MAIFRTATACLALSAAAIAIAADHYHLNARRDAFMREQYTSKAEFIAGLKAHPHSLKALARHFHVTETELLGYVSVNLHLGKTTKAGTYRIWGITRAGKIYSESHHFSAKLPVWETPGGTPVIRWLCSNPMAASLPKVYHKAIAIIPPPPPPVVPPPPPPVTPPPPPPPPPTPVVPPPPPPVVPVPVVPPPPPPVVTPPPPPAPVTPIVQPVVRSAYIDRFRLWFGATTWELWETGQRTYTTLGVSYDPIQFSDHHWEIGLYADSAGWMQNRPAYQYYGGGAEIRAYAFDKTATSWNPWISAGYGVYRVDIAHPFLGGTTIGGARFALGLDLGRTFFVEGSYSLFGNHFDRDLGRIEAAIGIRF